MQNSIFRTKEWEISETNTTHKQRNRKKAELIIWAAILNMTQALLQYYRCYFPQPIAHIIFFFFVSFFVVEDDSWLNKATPVPTLFIVLSYWIQQALNILTIVM